MFFVPFFYSFFPPSLAFRLWVKSLQQGLGQSRAGNVVAVNLCRVRMMGVLGFCCLFRSRSGNQRMAGLSRSSQQFVRLIMT